jgi:hypothetical protein
VTGKLQQKNQADGDDSIFQVHGHKTRVGTQRRLQKLQTNEPGDGYKKTASNKICALRFSFLRNRWAREAIFIRLRIIWVRYPLEAVVRKNNGMKSLREQLLL